ncbi:MAG: PEP-CTERM sorting domain-containing protein [Planctomycetes bacterium]|nr:PEP-CTERM sorting domain-containing protein [Planctomycetota bacterium]
MRRDMFVAAAAVPTLMLCASASAQFVFPTTGHAASNFIPFGSEITTQHQVFDANLFASRIGGQPIAQINRIAFSPGVTGTFNLGAVELNIGYTSVAPGSLALPSAGTNPLFPLSSFFSNPNYSVIVTMSGSAEWTEMILSGTFNYDPSLGNLLVEIIVNGAGNRGLHVSRASGGPQSSRAYDSGRFGSNAGNTTATRMQFSFIGVPAPGTLALLGLAGLAVRRRR